jgi:hypothetical protein
MPITFFIVCLAAWLLPWILVTTGGAGLDRRQGARAMQLPGQGVAQVTRLPRRIARRAVFCQRRATARRARVPCCAMLRACERLDNSHETTQCP